MFYTSGTHVLSTSLDLILTPKTDTPKSDDNLRDAPSKNKGLPKTGIAMRRCPAQGQGYVPG
eukprot:2743975-Pyramimonas_sp.AAC.1